MHHKFKNMVNQIWNKINLVSVKCLNPLMNSTNTTIRTMKIKLKFKTSHPYSSKRGIWESLVGLDLSSIIWTKRITNWILTSRNRTIQIRSLYRTIKQNQDFFTRLTKTLHFLLMMRMASVQTITYLDQIAITSTIALKNLTLKAPD